MLSDRLRPSDDLVQSTEKGGNRVEGAIDAGPIARRLLRHSEAPNRCETVISFANGFLIEKTI